ncbi:MAG: 3-phosphoserine/phosphohydroxythreonine transaminase [Planctomycetes bacterium]|jgi:phosphoserine aminotransferase|nr:3-phosphoserine/phosphohydroxythreonine transaminase [Planctomycetota bacterium]MCP4840042.1 3-phosphoserine/phosphohydroxythreonine transaminase [Planctomycetota bacterium]
MTAPTVSSTRHTLNFSAGPAVLPECVLEQAARDLIDLDDTGIGVLEHSHRGPSIDRIFEEAEADCRKVGRIPDEFEVLFLQGGASSQFGMIPMNFLREGCVADYVDTGSWTAKAIKDARTIGTANVAWSGDDSQYRRIPDEADLSWSKNAAYGYFCTNNTIYGTQWSDTPDCPAPLIADMSSDIFSRPIDWSRLAMAYAGAQKNIGPAGVTLVIIRKDLLEQGRTDLPAMFRYDIHAKKGSRYNTPPVFAVYCAGLVFKWILDLGGLDAVESMNRHKASLIYDAIDGSGGFYTGHADADSRSLMNIPFTTPNKELDAAFIAQASEHGMFTLKGHRSVGGIRASIYNAFPAEGCSRLAEFMGTFAASNRS